MRMPETATTMAARPTRTTAERLIAAAESLFAVHGIDGVSLREINRAAGARNASALQYHFRDRDGLLRALMVKHGREVEARRHAMLDAYEAEGRDDLRTLAGALVRPMAAKLSDSDGGPQRGPPLPADAPPRLPRRFAAIRIALVELGRRARSGPRRDERLFVSDL